MSEISTSWFAGLGDGIAAYAASAYEGGSEAGATLYDQLAGALTRLQGLPNEAAAAIGELTGALEALLGGAHDPAILDAGAGPAGGIAGTARPEPVRVVPRAVRRRQRIDAAAFAAFIRRQHPVKPAESAAALTGIPFDTMDKILARESLPNGPNFLLCLIAYGPSLLASVLPDAEERWLVGAQILADQARLNDEVAAAQAARAVNLGRWDFCGIAFGLPAEVPA